MDLKSEKLIFHVDVNSAFLSWEAARMVSEGKEDIRLIPSAVGGSRDRRTSVILAKSIPAKKFGITTGEPVSMALRKCPGLFLVKPDFPLYAKNSCAFMDICRRYTPLLEKYSIDECFLDMTGCCADTGGIRAAAVETATRLKNEIRDTLGFTVNVGIGTNKLLAKMASDLEKPDKVHTIFPDEVKTKMWPLPVGSLFSVGKSTSAKLNAAYIKTIGDLARADENIVSSLVGPGTAAVICAFARGEGEAELASTPRDAKGYNISTTFEQDISDRDEALGVIMVLCDSVARRMRENGDRAYCIGITLRDAGFRNRSHQKMLSRPTDITGEIYRTCSDLFDELWKGEPVRLIGVSLTELDKEGASQISFFDEEERAKDSAVDKTVDDIISRFGSGTIVRASALNTNVRTAGRDRGRGGGEKNGGQR